MMKKGLRFQTKLLLTLVFLILLVTISIITVTEAKVKRAYTSQFARDFQQQIDFIEDSRVERSRDFLELCRTLAAHPFVISSLRGEATDSQSKGFWKVYIESIRELAGKSERGPAGRGGIPYDMIGQIAIVDREGNFELITSPNERLNPSPGKRRRIDLESSETKEKLQTFLSKGTQETIYLPVETGDGRTIVKEMISTPVFDPATGAPVGLFLRAVAAETDAQRTLERYQDEFHPENALVGAIYLDGEIYSRGKNSEFTSDLGAAVKTELLPLTEAEKAQSRLADVELSGIPFRLYIAPLNREARLRRAFQVAAYPLSKLHADLAILRIQGSGIGLLFLLVGIGVAVVLSRNFARPILQLTDGTREIREGNLGHRVVVETRDEIGELATSFNEMAEELKQKALYRELLGKVSDETVAQALVSGSLDLELGGEVKEVSILFCDIRGFTDLTETMHPTDVISLLNDHMTAMTEIVREHFGVVDKFVGDEIMAVFGGLKSYENDAANAVACAKEMIKARAKMNEGAAIPIQIGIGVATGEVVAGCMGSVDRLNYTVLGARVNLAARLCGAAAAMELITDEETARKGGDTGDGETDLLALKGFRNEVPVSRFPTSTSATAEMKQR